MTDFGLDISCSSDLNVGRVATEQQLVLEAMFRRLTTKRGSVIDAPDDGIDVRDFLHRGMTAAERASVGPQIRAELLKDERVQRLSVDATWSTDGSQATVTLRGRTALGPFKLVLGVSDVSVDVLRAGGTA